MSVNLKFVEMFEVKGFLSLIFAQTVTVSFLELIISLYVIEKLFEVALLLAGLRLLFVEFMMTVVDALSNVNL
jgi:hypothetical protein